MKDRIIELLERKERVSLECIDPDGFDSENPINKFILKLDNIIIKKAILGWVGCRDKFVVDVPIEDVEDSSLNENSFIIFEDELKYFKIKEPEHTFNDLIDVAVQAVRDEVLSRYIYYTKGNGDEVIALYVGEDLKMQFFTGEEKRGIERIKSLYTETFVIESEEDVAKINNNVISLVLSNGCEIAERVCVFDHGVRLGDGRGTIALDIDVLKGATVTQKRGERK